MGETDVSLVKKYSKDSFNFVDEVCDEPNVSLVKFTKIKF